MSAAREVCVGIVQRPVLLFAIMMCPIAMCVASASGRVQKTVAPQESGVMQAPSPLPDSPGRSSIAFRELPACSTGQTPSTLTSRDKFQLFLKRTSSPHTYAGAGLSAGFSQLRNDKYGSGFKGYTQRYGANLADGATHSFFQTYLYAWIFHQDPRYHRLGEGSFGRRSLYFASRLFVGRTDGGRDAVNAPELLGTLTTSAMGNLYYPESDQGLDRTLVRAASMLGSRAGIFALHEFLPDIKRKLRRHEKETAKGTREHQQPAR